MRSAAAVLKAPIMMPLACAQISESGAPDILHDIDWRRGDGVEAMMQQWRRRDNLIYALPFAAALSLAHWP